jgi:thiol-disulfide isomerase/thioredoxin
MPALSFHGPDGKAQTLADFRGRTVLLNLWATWCAPCRKEMPGLDQLQAEMGGRDFEVVAINIDTRNLERPRAWLAEHNIGRLAYYADPEAKVFQDLKRAGQAVGMPTTILVDAHGCNLGVLHGAAEWASPDARRLISAALGR